MQEQLYKKIGRRYKPLGYADGWQGFPAEGIWLVKESPGCHSSECILKLGELQDMQPAVNLILAYKDKINDFLSKKRNEGKLHIYNNSLDEFTLELLKEITK